MWYNLYENIVITHNARNMTIINIVAGFPENI